MTTAIESSNRSPRINHVSWGRLEVEGEAEPYKDAKLFPGGSREWNWRETRTSHKPGIQIADVQELLEHGAKVVVLSRGMAECLHVPRETLDFLKNGKSPCTCCRRSMLWRFTTSSRKPRRLAACSIRRADDDLPQVTVKARHSRARMPSAARLISSSDAGFSNAEVSPSFSPRYAARTMRRMTFAFRVLGMSPTNKTSLGASALPSWAANAFSKL